MDGRDVGVVLLGTDAEVHAAGPRALDEIGDDLLKQELVRRKVVGSKISIRLGPIGGQLPKVPIGQPLRQLGAGRHNRGPTGDLEREDGQPADHCARQKYPPHMA